MPTPCSPVKGCQKCGNCDEFEFDPISRRCVYCDCEAWHHQTPPACVGQPGEYQSPQENPEYQSLQVPEQAQDVCTSDTESSLDVTSGNVSQKSTVHAFTPLKANQEPSTTDTLYEEYVASMKGFFYGGILFQGILSVPKLVKDSYNFPVRDDDVFIISYPRAGTTWITDMVMTLLQQSRGGSPRRHLPSLHYLEMGDFDNFEQLRKCRSPRIIQTHLPFHMLPAGVQNALCKVIYLVRNPKDTAVSYYHHHKSTEHFGRFPGNWQDFMSMFSDGKVPYGSWFDHLLGYWQRRASNNILYIRYEDIQKDLSYLSMLIADYLDVTLSVASLDTILQQYCLIPPERSTDASNDQHENNDGTVPLAKLLSTSKPVRQGQTGMWKQYFSVQQNEEFDTLYSQRMFGYGIKLEFDVTDGGGVGEGGWPIYDMPSFLNSRLRHEGTGV